MRFRPKGKKPVNFIGADPVPCYSIDEEALPCPFCGGKAMATRSADGFESVGCERCNPVFGVMVMGMDAVERWNGARR